MDFYELLFDDANHTPYWSLVIDEKTLEGRGGNIWNYSRGEKCKDLQSVPCTVVRSGQAADYNSDALTTAPIVSSRLAEILNKLAPNDIQLIRAELDSPGDWYVVNVLSLVDAIDYASSVMTFYDANHPRRGGKPSGVVRLILDNKCVGDHHVFRLKDWQIAKIVSASVKDSCQRAFMTRMKFIPTNLNAWMRYLEDPNADEWCFRPWRQIK